MKSETTNCPSGKIIYPNARWATKFSQQFNRRHRRRQRVYYCQECGGWHTSSYRPSAPGRAKRRLS